jgi:hypothetical protein
MSFQSLADVFAYVQTHDDLTSSEVLVLTAIAHHADRTGGNAYPTQPTLEKFTNLAPSGRTLLIYDVPDASPTTSSHPQGCQR